MITRFRVEGKADDKELLADELSEASVRIIKLLDAPGEWECTDDVISQVKGFNGGQKKLCKYNGRMVFLLHRDDG